jgi:glycosyltransferase involved in cell wall biosynthesis
MRILHVTPYFEGAWAYGGIPRAAAAMVQGLVGRGHRVTVCTTDAYRADARLPRAVAAPFGATARGDVRVFPNVSNAVAYHLQFFLPLGLGAFLRAHADEFEVAHLHGCHHVPGATASRILRKAGVPYVITPNGTAPYIERRQTAKRVFDATIGRGTLAGAAQVIAVSRAEAVQLARFGVPDSKLQVIPNPLDVTEFADVHQGLFRLRFGIGADQPIVMYLGKLTPRKRLDTLVEAFAALPDRRLRLVIAGNDMGYSRQLQRLIDQFAVRDRVLLTGLLSGRERLEALADADVVAYATELEVFGLVPVEALLCGSPVVVGNDSGCGEVIEETGGGLLVPPGNPTCLQHALARILAEPHVWRQQAARARRGALRYSSESVAAALESLYANIAGSARPSLRVAG